MAETMGTYLVVSATCETLAFSKHMAAKRSKAGSALAMGGAASGLAASRAATAAHAPAAHKASCSRGPPHHIDRMRTTHARAVRDPSLAITDA